MDFKIINKRFKDDIKTSKYTLVEKKIIFYHLNIYLKKQYNQ